ncbi:MAG TPA: DUF4011 domain-containing protein, partial [Tepidisphaeraceae bacterium]|nr:DUF4011 domain-containing protein [Tepidisphaeraceae bacterium]
PATGCAAPNEEALLASCRSSANLRPTHLLTRLTDKALDGKLTRLSLAAKTSQAEQGVNNLFVAFGLLRWFESKDSDEPVLSPILLMPARLKRASSDSEWQLAAFEDEVIPNYCLHELLRSDFKIEIPPVDDAITEHPDGIGHYLSALCAAVANHPRWEVQKRCVLGAFGFQKIAMWQDLETNAAAIASHPVCRAVAGDDGALRTGDGLGLGMDLDEQISPRDTHHILDCDSTQQLAIESVKTGAHLVLDGPPGTGKSQTIANIIAESLASGKTVLFVSEKAAALEVVKHRLDGARLGDFCLELHSHKANKKQVIDHLAQSLNLGQETYASRDADFLELVRLRNELNAYARALHAPRFALGQSAYTMHGRLAAVAGAPDTRCAIQEITKIDAARLAQMQRAVAAISDVRACLAASALHSWRGCKPRLWSMLLEDDIRHHFLQLADALDHRVIGFAGLATLGFLEARPALGDLDAALMAADQAVSLPDLPNTWFTGNTPAIAAGYRALHGTAKRFAEVRSKVAPYATAAIDQADLGLLNCVVGADPWLDAVAPHPCSQLRPLGQHLDAIAEELSQLRRLAQRLAACAEAALAALHRVGEAEKLPIDAMSRVSAAALLLSQVERAPASWFDEPARKALQERVGQFTHEAHDLAAERESLSRLFADRAFDPQAVEVLQEICRYGSWLRRLLPGWRKCRAAFTSLYASPHARSPKALLKDAARLLAHRRRQAAFNAAVQPHAARIGWKSGAAFDWDALGLALGRVAQLQSLSPIPMSLIAMLGMDGQGNQQAARDAATQLAGALADLKAGMNRLDEVYHMPLTNTGVKRWDAVAPAQLEQTIANAENAIRARRLEIEKLCGFLVEGADVAVADLKNQFGALATLKALRAQAVAAAAGIGLEISVPLELQANGWEYESDAADRLKPILDKTPQVPIHLVNVMTEKAVREQLRAALTTARSTLIPAYLQSLAYARGVFDFEQDVSVGITPAAAPLVNLIAWLRDRAADVHALQDWLGYLEVKDRLDSLGLGAMLTELINGAFTVEQAASAFTKRFCREWLDAVYASEPALGRFDLAGHETAINQFRKLDLATIEKCHERIRGALLADRTWQAGSCDAPASSERGVLLRESNKKRRHLPLRQLFKQMPALLLKLKPCMMMSPLAVSTFMNSEALTFDLVIFDEASQVRPHDAICAIYRGKQLVVAGDQQQLPPTNFFDRAGGEIDTDADDEADGPEELSTKDFESILDLCVTMRMPRRQLKWHYRSRRESLIAFSNHHFYHDTLVTFPSCHDVEGSSGVRLEYVTEGRWQGGSGGGVNPIEALKTAELVIQHARQTPELSLIVITMNVAQQMLVIEEIEKLKQKNPGLDEFFAEGAAEAFGVKNLENVQGDERDVIFLSVNYAKDAAGKLSHNFGPLNKAGGERRLNVAVTRAKRQVTVISSIRADDIDLRKTASQGARLLRAYLDFAQRGPIALAAELHDAGDRDFDSDFEADVSRALAAEGLQVRSQVGCGGFRIDLALINPEHPGHYVLGIECDGATYHSSATARDRDRLRQAVLEGLGWTLCRIWSTDWVRNPRRQIDRVLAQYAIAKDAHAPPPTAAASQGKPAAPQVPAPQAAVAQTPAARSPAPAKASPETNHRQHQFASIDEAPADVIDATAIRLLHENGATPEHDLTRAIARQLGFDRTGARITRRLGERIGALKSSEKIKQDELGRLMLPLNHH